MSDPYSSPYGDPFNADNGGAGKDSSWDSPLPSGGNPPPPSYGQPYGQSYPSMPPRQVQSHPDSVMVLVLGLLSLFFCALLGPFAWIKGSQARKAVRANPAMFREDGMLTAGWVLGIVASVMLILGFILFSTIIVLSIVFGQDTSSTTEYSGGDVPSYCIDNAMSPDCSTYGDRT